MDQQIRMGQLLKRLVFYLIASRILLFIAAYFLAISSPTQKVLPFESIWDFVLTFGKRWDGNSYTFIADHWYVTEGPEKYFAVFPPLYPVLVRALSFSGINSVLSGIILSNVFFILGMVVLYKLIALDYKPKIALLTVILISIFPTSFFFSVAYPESLFVFLFAASLYLSRKKSYFLAGITGGLATITRPFGILIFPALILQMIKDRKFNIKNVLTLLMTFGLPVIYYLAINYSLFGDTFAFAKLLNENWQKSFAFPWEGIVASWKRGVFTHEPSNYKYLVGYGEAIASTAAWIFVLIGAKKWGLKSPYFIYLFLSTALFTSTGFILSAPRYLLSIPPFFILMASFLSRNKIVTAIWIITSVVLLFYIANEFAWGQWTF